MKKIVLFVLPFALLFIFVAVPVVQAQSEELPAKNIKEEVSAQELNVGTPLVAYCWTCGGDYPYTAGVAETNSFTYWAYELGPGCSGGFSWRTDRYPRLCTR